MAFLYLQLSVVVPAAVGLFVPVGFCFIVPAVFDLVVSVAVGLAAPGDIGLVLSAAVVQTNLIFPKDFSLSKNWFLQSCLVRCRR